MTISRDGNLIYLSGDCRVEEAEQLSALLDAGGDWRVDLSACRQAHAAVVQALLYFRPALHGRPEGEFLRTWVAPALAAREAKSTSKPYPPLQSLSGESK